VRREFGRNIPPLSNPSSPARPALLNGVAGGVRALATVTTGPPPTPSMSRARPSSSAFANHGSRQAASNSVSSTTTTSSDPSATGSPRLSQSSMSSVAEVKTESAKAVEDSPEEVVARESGATLASALSPKSPLVAQQQQHSSTLSSSSRTLRRRSRDSQVSLAYALKPLTGEGSHSGSRKRASVGAVSPTSKLIPGIYPLGAMGLGGANLGEAAQGWVDSVGSKLAELQRGQT
jgi:hypothetical protein